MEDVRRATVDIVTVSYRHKDQLLDYLEALSRVTYPADRVKLIIVDNGPQADSLGFMVHRLRELPFAAELVRAGRNLGFGAGCNYGAERGAGAFILFLNPDAQIAPETLSQLVARALEEPDAGLIEAAQQPMELRKWRDPGTNYTDWCSGAALLARRPAFVQVGMFDNLFYPAYTEDVDLSWRMWLAGWKCVYAPNARVRHVIPEHGGPRPEELALTIRFSFVMRLIYDNPRGIGEHFVRGLRYLFSPRTDSATRWAVLAGVLGAARSWRRVRRRRFAAQTALARCPERQRFVFSEWGYGRWMP